MPTLFNHVVDRFVPLACLVRASRPFAAVQRLRLERWLSGAQEGPPPAAYKQSEVLRYADAFDLSVLVETGTLYGGLILATRGRFDRAYTIELDPRLHRRAERMFRDDPTVTPILGDSADELEKVLEELDRSALFWLDAHYSGRGTARADIDTSVRRELESILADPEKEHVVLIDDAHDFGRLRDYPSLAELEAVVAAARPDLEVRVESDIIRIHPANDHLGTVRRRRQGDSR